MIWANNQFRRKIIWGNLTSKNEFYKKNINLKLPKNKFRKFIDYFLI